MRKLTLLSIFLLVSTLIFAQQTISFSDYVKEDKEEEIEEIQVEEDEFDDPQIQTVMNSFELKRISGFGGPTISYTNLNGEYAVLTGGGGGIAINNFFLGGYGEGLSNTMNENPSNNVSIYEFGHGGFWLGYEFMRERMIHPVLSTRAGWGRVKGYQNGDRFSKSIFVVVPTLSAEINFTRFFKVNVGVEYRQTLGADYNSLNNSHLSGVGVYTNFVFGWF